MRTSHKDSEEHTSVLEVQRVSRAATTALVVAVLSLAALAFSVGTGTTEAFDRRLLFALRNPSDPADPIGPYWLEEMVRDFTALGSTGVLTLIVIIIAGFLFVSRKYSSAFYVMAAVASGAYINSLLKIGFARGRPDVITHGVDLHTASFPSGHSAGAALTYLTLGLLLAHTQQSRAAKTYIFSVSVLLTAIVGLSRIYLGVHWPTDVLAGWAFGTAWALFCWMALRWQEGSLSERGL